ncbi:MAG: O-antigen ligase family protein [Ignavibacteria bacterium]|nr:O-antigen ligase family protein [Ignavibacteria bacterium]
MTEISRTETLLRKIYFALVIFCIIILNYGIIINKKVFLLAAFGIPLVFLIFFSLRKYYLEIFIISLFFTKVIYWPLRLYPTLIFALLLIFFYLTHKDENIFNHLKVPTFVKTSSAFLITTVFIAGILTPYFSFFTVYYSFIFLMFFLTAYIVFKSITDFEKIKNLFNAFILGTFIAGITKIIAMIDTGFLRALGSAEYYYMEFTPIALIMILFLYYVSGDLNPKIVFISIFLFITMIADQSRFAWLGLIISLVYGIIISFILSPEIKIYLKKKFPVIVIVVIISIGLVFALGLHKIITTRVSEVHFEFFQSVDLPQDQVISNSLESRMLIWITAYNTFLQHPITGVGYFMFLEVSENYNIFPDFIYDLYIAKCDAHTTYFNFLVDTGILGLSAFLIFGITIYILSFKSIKISPKENKTVSVLLNVLMFHMLFNSLYAGSYNLVPSAFLFYSISASVVANYLLLKEKLKINS